MPILNRISPSDVTLEIKDPVDPSALSQATAIIDEVRVGPNGQCCPDALTSVGIRFGDLPKDTPFLVSAEECKAAYDGLATEDRQSLLNIVDRVRTFAEAQRRSVTDTEIDIPGGRAGQTVSPCRAGGCYAPGGRYPLPSSVVMTVVTARAAGVDTVVLCSPRPAPITLAAAHASGCDVFLRLGGAQAIAALAHGVPGSVPQCDVIVGPGNKWVTAAKSIVSGRCGIDMLAGPSEVLVICDKAGVPSVIAADLIAQAEHDVVARAIILSDDEAALEAVDAEVTAQVEALPEPNRSTAITALKQSFAVLCKSVEECVRISDDIAPEHLEIHTADAMKVAMSCRNYGGLFVGEAAAEALGDYGAGPNHTLPTGGTGRYTGGLSVFNFLRIRTWMRVDDKKAAQGMVEDSVRMARLEGLEGHARAAEARLISKKQRTK